MSVNWKPGGKVGFSIVGSLALNIWDEDACNVAGYRQYLTQCRRTLDLNARLAKSATGHEASCVHVMHKEHAIITI
jgi:hypothetical protein